MITLNLNLFGQQYKYSDVPVLTLSDFKDAPKIKGMKNALAYTGFYVSYNIKEKSMVSNSKLKIVYQTRVFLRKDISWLDKKSLSRDKNKLSQILNHERGHLLIAYILANELQKRMSKMYIGDYHKQAKTVADMVFAEFRNFEYRYDMETNHSNNISKQREWNKKLISFLE
jgi:predicted secreted Zn-dependent protease